MTFSSTRPNLLINTQGRNDTTSPGGDPIERLVTVHNRGRETADIHVWIKPNNAKSTPLMRWCSLTTHGVLREDLPPATGEQRTGTLQEQEQGFSGIWLRHVQAGESREVRLRFDVPLQAEPEFYSYDILAQAPVYTEEQSSCTQQFRVLATRQGMELRSEPDWSLDPPTSSDQPYTLTAGTPIQITVQVHNQTEVVDRYHLRCPELDRQWFTIDYPEANPDAPGLSTSTDGLMLNPGESGSIQLTLHPPAHTPAGYYSSTLRLLSFVRNNLVLLDIIYLNIAVDDRLIAQLHPPSRKLPAPEDWFQLTLTNPGNIPRTVQGEVDDPDGLFTYRLIPEQVSLPPGQSGLVQIHPSPRKWWRRSWRGQEQSVKFAVRLHALSPQEEASPVLLPIPAETVSGEILWQSRSPWLRRLLWLLLLLLLLAAAGGLLYWVLREWVVKPSLTPKILEFSTTEEAYPVSSGNPIRLNWEISNPESAPIGKQPPEEPARAIATYYTLEGQAVFSHPYSLPELLQSEDNTCEPGTYQPHFVVRLLRPLYGYPAHIPTLTCLGLSPQPDSPDATALAPGKYQIKLEVFPSRTAVARDSQSQNSSDVRRLKPVEVTPPPPPATPEITHFYSKSLIYRQTPDPAEATGLSPQYPASPIPLNWIINYAADITALELSYVQVALDGSIQNKQVRYEMENGLPVGLTEQCQVLEQRLMCEDVPTEAETPGQYTFTLTVIRPEGRNQTRIAKETEAIAIRPPLPSIQSFNANGQDVLENPYVVQIINPARGAMNVTLSWQVENPEQMKVELLPAPGELNASLNRMTYALSPTPGSATLTLQVTNQAGEMVSRSVTIQTAAFTAPPPPPPDGATVPPPPPNIAVPSVPQAPDELPTYELPPRLN